MAHEIQEQVEVLNLLDRILHSGVGADTLHLEPDEPVEGVLVETKPWSFLLEPKGEHALMTRLLDNFIVGEPSPGNPQDCPSVRLRVPVLVQPAVLQEGSSDTRLLGVGLPEGTYTMTRLSTVVSIRYLPIG